jgi:hypothetical protein
MKLEKTRLSIRAPHAEFGREDDFSVGVGQAPCDSFDTNRSGLEKLT